LIALLLIALQGGAYARVAVATLSAASSASVLIDIHKQAQKAAWVWSEYLAGRYQTGRMLQRPVDELGQALHRPRSTSDVVRAGQPLTYYQDYWDSWLDANPKRLADIQLSDDMATRHGVTVIVLIASAEVLAGISRRLRNPHQGR